MRKIYHKIQAIDVFLIVSLGITGCAFLLNILSRGRVIQDCVLGPNYLFSDYFSHIAGSSDRLNMYSVSEGFCFPPLAYCMYWMLWRITPYYDSESILNWENYKYADNALLVFVLYNILFTILLVYCIVEYYKKTGVKYMLLLPTAILVSYPFFCTSLQRGNSVALVAVMVSLAWLWMDSENKVKQELAMILIAVAAGFKFYPAILGIAYLQRRDWKRAVRLVVYGLFFVFVPFLFFGGANGVTSLTESLLSISTREAYSWGTVRGIATDLSMQYLQIDYTMALKIGICIETVFLISSILCFFLSHKKWQRVLFISGILASYIASSFMYTSVYYLPALFMLLYEYQGGGTRRKKVWGIFHASIFGVIFSVSFFWLKIFEGGEPMVKGTFVLAYLLLIINMLEVIYTFGKREKHMHQHIGILKRAKRR